MNIEAALVFGSFCALISVAEAAPVFGPFDANARGAGPGHIEWFDGPPPTEPGDPWTMAAWVKPKPDFSISIPTLVAGFGDGVDFHGAQRFLAADADGWFFWYGTRILPAYASDNYLSLLPGEKKTVTIRSMQKDAPESVNVTLDGWNIAPASLSPSN